MAWGQLWLTACCLLLLAGGCAPRQGGGQSVMVVTPEKNESLSSAEMAALRSTGELDRNLSPRAMEDVKLQYTYFLRKGRPTMDRFSKRAERYLAYARKVFRDRGMPEELACLAMVESGYRADARSPAGAAGAWQFMPFTGDKFGLSQDFWTDERLDTYEATEAAAAYLQKLHDDFGDWYLAIAAYNAGEGKIGRACDGTGCRDFFALKANNHRLDCKAQLREETKQYVPRFLAMTKIMRNLPKLGFDSIHPEAMPEVRRLQAGPGTDLEALAQACGMDRGEFSLYNPHHKRPVSNTGRVTNVYVPAHNEAAARAFLASPAATPFAGWEFCAVRRGESWAALSQRSGVPEGRLRAANPGLASPRRGATVFVPRAAGLPLLASGAPAGAARPAVSAQRRAAGGKHVVQAGETLLGISRAHNVPLWDIMRCNGIRDPRELKAGMTLHLPASAVAAQAPAPAGRGRAQSVTPAVSRRGTGPVTTYTVRDSDSLWRIARAHQVSVDDLKRWNGVDEKSLRVGTRLVVRR